MYLEMPKLPCWRKRLTTWGGDKSLMAGSQTGSSEIKDVARSAQPCQETPWSSLESCRPVVPSNTRAEPARSAPRR